MSAGSVVRMALDSTRGDVRIVIRLPSGLLLDSRAKTVDAARERAKALARRHGVDVAVEARAAAKALRRRMARGGAR